MSLTLAQFTEKLVSISEFSQGKAGKIFADVAKNNHEYIVLKNNQPTAVVMSVEDYRKMQEGVWAYEKMVERLQSIRASKSAAQTAGATNSEFEELIAESRLTEEELEALAECIELE